MPQSKDARFLVPAGLGIALWAFLVLDPRLAAVGCLLGWGLLVLALIDWRIQVLPNVLTFPLIGLGLAVSALGWTGPIFDHLVGAVAGYAVFWAVSTFYSKVRGYDGLGLGDAKLLAAGGAWAGWQGLASIVLIGSVAALLGAMLALRGKEGLTGRTEIPFGTFLAPAIWITWLYGNLV